MREPSVDDLLHRIADLESANRFWKRLALGGMTAVGVLLLFVVALGVLGVNLALDIEAARLKAEVQMNRARLLETEAQLQRDRALHELEKARDEKDAR
jgi:hypothetical protein